MTATKITRQTSQTSTKSRPIICWAGGKARLLKHLLPHIPPHTLYCEVFFGGGALFCGKPPGTVEIINDTNGDLVSSLRCCKYHLEPMLDELGFILSSRQDFEDYCRQPGLTEIQRVARWFTRNKLSFGGDGVSFAIGRTRAPNSRERWMEAIRALNWHLDHTTIEHGNWSYILDTYDAPATFFYVDPPYLDVGGKNYDA
jgi:DNA adenine methylase